MRIIRILLILAVCVAALGFFRGWFSFSGHSRDPVSNKVNVSLTVDPDKMKEDATKVTDKTSEMAGKAANEVKEIKDQAKSNLKPEDK